MTEKALKSAASLIAWLTVLATGIMQPAASEVSTPASNTTGKASLEGKNETGEHEDKNRKALRTKLDKDRLNAFLDLLATIEKQDVPPKLLDMAWSDGLEDAKKTLGVKAPEYRNMLAKCSEYYQRHNRYEEAESLYDRDMQDLVGFKTNRFDNLALTTKQTVLLSEDMLNRAAIIDLRGKRSREALEQRKQAIALLDKAGLPVNLDKRAILAHGFVIAGDDNSARREYERYTKEAPDKIHKFSGLVSLARLEARQKNFQLALDYYDKVKKLLGGPPLTDPYYPSLQLELGRLNVSYKRPEAAIACYKQMLSFMEMKKPIPADIYAAAMCELSGIYREKGEYAQYLEYVERCVDYVTANSTKIDLLYAINPLLLAAKTPNIDAHPYYERAIALAETRKNKEGLLRCLLELSTYEQRENWPAARERYYKALAMARQEKLFMFPPLRQVGGAEYAYGNYKRALTLFKEAAAWIKGTEYESLHPEAYADLLVRMAACYACECNFKESQKLFDEFDKYCPSQKEYKHQSLVNAMYFESRAQIAWLEGDYESMRTCFEKAQSLRRLNGVKDRERITNIINHMRVLHVKNFNDDMQPTLANALIGLDAMKSSLGPYSAYRAMLTHNLAQCLQSAGLSYEAEVVSKRAEEDKRAVLEHFAR